MPLLRRQRRRRHIFVRDAPRICPRPDPQDMEMVEVYRALLQGADEAERGEFVPDNFVDVLLGDLKADSA